MARVLLVDDNRFERDGIRRILSEKIDDISITDVDDGYKAIEKLRDKSYDLLITDMKMPMMDGNELVKSVRAFNQKIAILVISGYDDFEYAKKMLPYRVANYLLKPVNIAELVEVVKGCLPLDEAQLSTNPYICEAIKMIQTDFALNITLEEVARRVFISPSYFSLLFKREMRINFNRFLLEFRMKKAEELLKDTNMKVTEIVKFVGFGSVGYFDKLFKQEFQLTPAQYRGKYRDKHDTMDG